MTPEHLRQEAREYYERKLRAYGATPAGVDWNSRSSQELRFSQLAVLWDGDPGASIADYGCGYGALASYLRADGHHGPYVGFDVSEAMIDAARRAAGLLPACRFTSLVSDVGRTDYAVASGVLNVKQDTTDDMWRRLFEETLADLASIGSRGFAFNALTSYSDPDKQRLDLYYADPLYWFDYCRRTYSRFVTLLHDYPLWEFTLIVRRPSA